MAGGPGNRYTGGASDAAASAAACTAAATLADLGDCTAGGTALGLRLGPEPKQVRQTEVHKQNSQQKSVR